MAFSFEEGQNEATQSIEMDLYISFRNPQTLRDEVWHWIQAFLFIKNRMNFIFSSTKLQKKLHPKCLYQRYMDDENVNLTFYQ